MVLLVLVLGLKVYPQTPRPLVARAQKPGIVGKPEFNFLDGVQKTVPLSTETYTRKASSGGSVAPRTTLLPTSCRLAKAALELPSAQNNGPASPNAGSIFFGLYCLNCLFGDLGPLFWALWRSITSAALFGVGLGQEFTWIQLRGLLLLLGP